MKLNGKSVVVTGASSGMGKAIVERFAKEGANIIAVARRKERLEALAESLKDEPGTVIPYVGDISKEETNVNAIDAAVEQMPHNLCNSSLCRLGRQMVVKSHSSAPELPGFTGQNDLRVYCS